MVEAVSLVRVEIAQWSLLAQCSYLPEADKVQWGGIQVQGACQCPYKVLPAILVVVEEVTPLGVGWLRVEVAQQVTPGLVA